ncbi:hypothetical protein ACIPSA_34030 [Streptomyces sp. NPDC086549]|uniref:hypothetical protein n=1 Tax=Streptomyces sp. NPDC086549 TaxID=3365752 RepID=UPI0037F64954
MSLSVDVFVREPDETKRVLDVPEGCEDAAGFESWRTTVWGSEQVRSLGARFFPVLAEGDLEVEAGQVHELLREVALLRAHLDPIAYCTEHPRTIEEHRRQIEERLRIIEKAALRASLIGGGILIR